MIPDKELHENLKKDDNDEIGQLYHPVIVNRKEKLLGLIWRNMTALSWIIFTLGIVWIFLFPAVTISTVEMKMRGTYFSESALLTRYLMAQTGTTEATDAVDFHRAFTSLPDLPWEGCKRDCAAVELWVENSLRQIGAEVYKQTFFDSENRRQSSNMYAIIRGGYGADGKESLGLVAHYRNLGSRSKNKSISSLGIALSLMKHFSTVKWLAKDVILVLPDGILLANRNKYSSMFVCSHIRLRVDGQLDGRDGFGPGTKNWVDAYVGGPSMKRIEPLPNYAGILRGVIVLDLDETHGDFNSMNILGAGINGKLPNLDLINTAVHSFKTRSIPVRIESCGQGRLLCTDVFGMLYPKALGLANYAAEALSLSSYQWSYVRTYTADLVHLLQFMQRLAFGPSGLHAYFTAYDIDSITLESHKYEGKRSWKTDELLTACIRGIEVVVHSISNLEEKFHQSFYLYLLPNDKNFVSVGEYYYALAMILVPSFACMIRLVATTNGIRIAYGITSALIASGFGLLFAMIISHAEIMETYSRFFISPEYSNHSESIYKQFTLFIFLVTMSVVGFFLLWIVFPLLSKLSCFYGCDTANPWFIENRIRNLNQQVSEAKLSGIQLYSIEEYNACVKAIQREYLGDSSGWKALKVTCMAVTVFVHCIMGILNFPLALICALCTSLFSCIAPAAESSLLRNILTLLWLILSTPLVLCLIMKFFYGEDLMLGLWAEIDRFGKFGSFHVIYLCCYFFPIHILSWTIFVSPAAKKKID